MAIARPVRVLLFAAAVLWCFFLYQVFRPSSGLRGPGERYVNFERDPNLDRSCPPAVLNISSFVNLTSVPL